ncbi:hypothetical protein KIN20_018684 [Parelaphostrongylus tenuis]|uniref:Uncharacterized protein n=1 Tax=Parelaphostrongylus tenuis TaxID=148309 RepID=A0AAD5N403_PARTN|nr:hypothetical protein KIN20_018684 [Parelaphostrongylus tenuis]
MCVSVLGRTLNMENNMNEERDRKRKATWAVFGPLKEATDQVTTTNYALIFLIQQSSQHSVMQRRRGLILRARQEHYKQLTERLNDAS